MKKYIILLLCLMITIVGCKKEIVRIETIYLENVFSIMPCIKIMEKEKTINYEEIKNDLNKILLDLHYKYDVFNDNSLISKVNNMAGIDEVIVDNEFISLVKITNNVSNITKINDVSLYDISIHSVWKVWDFTNNYYQHYNYANIPTDEIIKQKLPLVNYNNILINEENNTLYLKEKGMSIDLGSMIKGYSADLIHEYLIERGYNNFLIDVGGNVITNGFNISEDRHFTVGINMPFSYNNVVGSIKTQKKKMSFVTSGIYERYIVSKGDKKMYHHILNPNTGYPENNELYSVTIVSNNSCYGDCFSTAVFLMGLDEGLKFIESRSELEAVFITKDKEIQLSSGLKSIFNLNKNQNDYKIKN